MLKMDLDRIQQKFRIIAPLSKEAEEKMYRYELYNTAGEIADIFEYMLFDFETAEYMERRLFDLISATFNISILFYEEEVLENQNIPEAINLIKRLTQHNDDKRLVEFATDLINLMEIAYTKGTSVGFYF